MISPMKAAEGIARGRILVPCGEGGQLTGTLPLHAIRLANCAVSSLDTGPLVSGSPGVREIELFAIQMIALGWERRDQLEADPPVDCSDLRKGGFDIEPISWSIEQEDALAKDFVQDWLCDNGNELDEHTPRQLLQDGYVAGFEACEARVHNFLEGE